MLYKVLNEDATPCHGGSGKWYTSGKWMPAVGVHPRKSGYHLCREENLLEWITNGSVWEAKHRGELIETYYDVVVAEARIVKKMNWDKKVARLYACDCAERVLHLANDERCNEAVRVSRAYARGEASEKELATAWDDARAASGDAGDAWPASGDVWAAGRATARAATWAASWDEWAARDGARAARTASWVARAARYGVRGDEQEWQTQRLIDYLHGRIG